MHPGQVKRVLFIALLALLLPAAASATTRHATPSTFNSVYGAAVGGDVILLAGGTYPTITGKDTPGTGRIVIRPESGAKPSVNFRFDGVVNDLTLSNLTITSGHFTGANAERITVQNSNIPGQIIVDQRDGFVNSGVQFLRNDFHDYHAVPTSYEGRLSICGCGANSNRNGVIIRDNTFRGGASDGIQDSGSGTRIIHNEFYGLQKDDAAGVHADPIQTWDGCCHVIKGNYFHDLPETSVLMMPDGIDHEVITDNVVAVTAPYPYTFTVFDDNQSTIRYNTLAWKTNCIFGNDCGGIRMGTKFPGSTGDEFTKIDHNIVGWINQEDGTTAVRASNLVASGSIVGSEVRGVPTFVGGAVPSSYCGYALTATSAGQGWGARTNLYC